MIDEFNKSRMICYLKSSLHCIGNIPYLKWKWHQDTVVQKVDSTIHRINHYPVDKKSISETNIVLSTG